MVVDGSVISNATNCGFYLNNVDDVYYMIGGHLDYNAAGGVCGTAANIELANVWEEQLLGPIVNIVGPTTAVDVVKNTGGNVVLTGAGTSADIWHVEGLYETQVIVQNPLIEQPTGTITNAIGLGATTGTTVCLKDISGPHGYGITGTIYTGCKYQVPLQLNYGSREAIFSPSTTYQTATQGWNIAWNIGLSGRSGEMDFINTHGGGSGGFAFCDGAFGYTPSTCQAMLDNAGNWTIQGRLVPGTVYSAAGTALPACASALKAQQAVVSDATSPSYLGTYTSGGAVLSPVICNGTNWVTY